MPNGARKGDSATQAAATIPAPPSSSRAGDVPQHTSSIQELEGSSSTDDFGEGSGSKPTTVPDYDVEALAAASFHGPKRVQLPLDLSVPVRKRASMDGAPLRAAFLLLHVDDRLSIAEIATTTQIPVAEAIENFILLADLGVVELRGASHVPAPPPEPEPDKKSRPPAKKSGLRPKT